jgi:hypothetical protein
MQPDKFFVGEMLLVRGLHRRIWISTQNESDLNDFVRMNLTGWGGISRMTALASG